ncbi:cation transporter [Arthrobacter sp. KNU40]|uniref:cation transporter n=1 Tax=Arthrobacter sp. KNU40 TaxID=3447965 RepID=UPI003F5F4521
MSTATTLASSDGRRAVLSRRIRLFAAATISYNLIEAVAALWAGGVADSSALIGFGLDSVIEVTSALVLSWQFSARDPERREHLTLRIIAVSFFALAAFVTADAARALTGAGEPQHSTPGIIIAALSLGIMPVLSWAQRRAGRELGSRTAVADSKQTLLCTYLSAVLLAGLVLNSTLGWWWADPVAALAIAAIAVREGINAWRGDACCAVAYAGHSGTTTEAGPGADRPALDDCCAPAAADPDTAVTVGTAAPGQAMETAAGPGHGAGPESVACCAECASASAPKTFPIPPDRAHGQGIAPA